MSSQKARIAFSPMNGAPRAGTNRGCGGCGSTRTQRLVNAPQRMVTRKVSNTETKPDPEIAQGEVVATGSGWYRDAGGNTYHGKDALPDHLTLIDA